MHEQQFLAINNSFYLNFDYKNVKVYIIQLFNVWEVNSPEYFPPGAGNSSMRSIARGHDELENKSNVLIEIR